MIYSKPAAIYARTTKCLEEFTFFDFLNAAALLSRANATFENKYT